MELTLQAVRTRGPKLPDSLSGHTHLTTPMAGDAADDMVSVLRSRRNSCSGHRPTSKSVGSGVEFDLAAHVDSQIEAFEHVQNMKEEHFAAVHMNSQQSINKAVLDARRRRENREKVTRLQSGESDFIPSAATEGGGRTGRCTSASTKCDTPLSTYSARNSAARSENMDAMPLGRAALDEDDEDDGGARTPPLEKSETTKSGFRSAARTRSRGKWQPVDFAEEEEIARGRNCREEEIARGLGWKSDGEELRDEMERRTVRWNESSIACSTSNAGGDKNSLSLGTTGRSVSAEAPRARKTPHRRLFAKLQTMLR